MSEEKPFWDNSTKVLTAISGFITSIGVLLGAVVALYKIGSSKQAGPKTDSILSQDVTLYLLILIFGCLSAAAIAYLIWRHLSDARTGKKLRAEKDALARFLGIRPDEQPQIRIVVPTRELTKMLLRSGDTVPYEVNMIADSDVHAAFEFNKMLYPLYSESKNFPYVPDVNWIDEAAAKRLEKHTLFLVGGPIANRMVGDIVKNHPYVSCKRATDGDDERLYLCSNKLNFSYHIHPASGGRKLSQVESESTFGCVIKDRQHGLTRITAWGLDEKGTYAAAKWLALHWKEHLRDDTFVVVLHIAGGNEEAEKLKRAIEGLNVWIPETAPRCKICHTDLIPKDAVALPED